MEGQPPPDSQQPQNDWWHKRSAWIRHSVYWAIALVLIALVSIDQTTAPASAPSDEVAFIAWFAWLVDGKTVRGAKDKNGKAPHLVAALAHGIGAVLGQVAVEAKSNEIPAVRDLLKAFASLASAVVTIDAMHTQHDTAQVILGRGADYVMTVKANMPTLYRQLKKLPWARIPAVSSVSTDHGRRARRTIKVALAPAWIGFDGAAQVAQLRRTVTRKGKKTVEVVYLITSDRDAVVVVILIAIAGLLSTLRKWEQLGAARTTSRCLVIFTCLLGFVAIVLFEARRWGVHIEACRTVGELETCRGQASPRQVLGMLAWHAANVVPVLDIPHSLEWHRPARSANAAVGASILALRLWVAIGVLAVLKRLWDK